MNQTPTTCRGAESPESGAPAPRATVLVSREPVPALRMPDAEAEFTARPLDFAHRAERAEPPGTVRAPSTTTCRPPR
ncbi:hypothetical protein [Streptomyces sp. NPDC059564]|uniref:hypothetical protein n=1 Tax=Streptomyces sp. NPDC059564 TaxID=3346865 RepID=UPI003674DF8D